jgi:hypothetical protein
VWEVEQISETAGVFNSHVAEGAANLEFYAPAEPLRAHYYLALRRKATVQKDLL